MKAHLRTWMVVFGFLCLLNISGTRAIASVIAIGPDAFPSGSLLIDFSGLALGTEVNGLTVNGVLFTYKVDGVPGNNVAIIGGTGFAGPGTTNNIGSPYVTCFACNSGTLTMTLPAPSDRVGYGYAVLTPPDAREPTPNATTISLFDGITPIGSLSYLGLPDPEFVGGFAGIQSTVSFDRVDVTFALAAGAFALDNVKIGTAVPEPASLAIFGMGLLGLAVVRQRRSLQKPQRHSLGVLDGPTPPWSATDGRGCCD